jgi:DNA-binding CsgD family transcriptional regulator
MSGLPFRLVKDHLQNTGTYQCVVSEDDYIKIEPSISLLKRLSDIQKSIFTVYDMNRKNYLLKSPNFKKMLGYTDPEEIENDDMEQFHKIIHQDDLPFVLETENKAFEFFSGLPAAEKKGYKLVYDFRIKNTVGIFMRFLHQISVLEQDRYGKTWLLLIVTDLISEKALESKPQRRMINIDTGKLYLFQDDDEFHTNTLLTNRENQILRLISQGLDSKDISEQLFISVNTVNNHRQKILHKTKTENTSQALFYAKSIGII